MSEFDISKLDETALKAAVKELEKKGYDKISDTEIGINSVLTVGYTAYRKMIFDFLNCETYILTRTGSSDGGIGISERKNFDEMQSLAGVKQAYEALKIMGGTPPEIDFSETQKKKSQSLRSSARGFQRTPSP